MDKFGAREVKSVFLEKRDTMEVKLIVFGKIASGKDSFFHIFNTLTKEDGITCEIAKIGGEIRKEVDDNIKLLNLPASQARSLYVEYGETVRGIFGEDLWNEKLYVKIKDKDNVIIADGRKINELKFWQDKGYIPVAILADEEIRSARVLQRDGYDQTNMFNNPTEIACEECIQQIISDGGLVVHNQGSVTDLIEEAKRVYRVVKYKGDLL